MTEKTYNVGIYCRLSNDDERDGESVSIENQKLLLQRYVLERGWNLVDVYIDDGYSGTNFQRPGVQRLIEDAKAKKINVILVKDLSRFGRNYIEFGQYTDYLFPSIGCRFIALNNGIDTESQNGSTDVMCFLNLFNEFYSRDTSKKVKAVKKADQMSVVGDDGGGGTKITTPAFFVGMTITTYGVTTARSQNALTNVKTGTEVAKVELILKVVDARSAETIKSKNIDASAFGQLTGAAGNLREQVLQSAAKKACEKIVYELIKLTPFGILDVENGVVTLDVPGSLKIMGKPVQTGTQFVVSKLGKGKKSKRTGKVTRSETQVAVVSVTSVGEDSCTAKIVNGKIEPIGDDEDTQYDPYIVKINEGAAGTPPPPPPPEDNGAPF